jgi:hypothetical protein
MKIYIVWDIRPCSPLKISQRFGWTYRRHLQGRRISQAIKKQADQKEKLHGVSPENHSLNQSTLYVAVLISLWFFQFAAQPKEFFLDGLKKLEQRSYKCVELGGEYVE